jgi:hypothetical protein
MPGLRERAVATEEAVAAEVVAAARFTGVRLAIAKSSDAAAM